MKVVPMIDRKQINKVDLNDKAIEKLKVADFEFSQIYAPDYPRNLVQYQDEMKVDSN